MDIEKLLNKYFEGETSCEEERQLRAFFTKGCVPEYLAPYQALFGYLEEEIKIAHSAGRKITFSNKLKKWSLSGAAAVILLLIGFFTFHEQHNPCLCADNYVIINGKCYTDKNTIKQYALRALQQVSSSPDEWLIDLSDKENQEVVETELSKLASVFSESDF